MQFLVRLSLSSGSRPSSEAEGRDFIENYIFPTLKRCSELQERRSIVAGGPESGAVALALIVDAGSAVELDNLITSLPVWPRMETKIKPLTTFEDRRRSIDVVLELLESREQKKRPPDAVP